MFAGVFGFQTAPPQKKPPHIQMINSLLNTVLTDEFLVFILKYDQL